MILDRLAHASRGSWRARLITKLNAPAAVGELVWHGLYGIGLDAWAL
jgi:hypothetical protein